MQTLTFDLEGLHCQSCVGTVEKALNTVGGVTCATVDLGASKATVEGQGLDPSTLQQAVEQSGYKAQLSS